ncbi:MAG: 4'-phosphopantetheinyl transferase superfamily protein [Chloroflexi bacterium]|nr:4'-phosphopantetheinyl transferase superfamily protein [Chloroflexota bacterium]
MAVVHVDLAADADHEAEAVAWLNEAERGRWEGYPYSGPQRQFLLCRAALRAALCEQLGCGNAELAFETSEHGKPWARVGGVEAPISFNVSHGGQHGLIAIAPGGRLGVDVEELADRRNLDLLMDGVLGENEHREIASKGGDDQLRSFFRLWTMKEALLKAHGKGLLVDATTFEIPPTVRRGAPRGQLELPQLPGVTLQVEDIGGEEFAAALAREVVSEAGSERAKSR